MHARQTSTVIESFTDLETARKRSIVDKFFMVVSIIVFILFLPLSVLFSFKRCKQFERMVKFRLGFLDKTHPTVGPGMIFILPCTDQTVKVDLRITEFEVIAEEILTKDATSLTLTASVYYRVVDPVKVVLRLVNYKEAIRLRAATELYAVVGCAPLTEFLADRSPIEKRIQENLLDVVDTWGIQVEHCEIKEIILPEELEKAMTAEAEANRLANAKIILAEAEVAAAKSLVQAAEEIGDNPTAIQLRYLQELSKLSTAHTFIIPLPESLLGGLGYLANIPCKQGEEIKTPGLVKSVEKDKTFSTNFGDRYLEDTLSVDELEKQLKNEQKIAQDANVQKQYPELSVTSNVDPTLIPVSDLKQTKRNVQYPIVEEGDEGFEPPIAPPRRRSTNDQLSLKRPLKDTGDDGSTWGLPERKENGTDPRFPTELAKIKKKSAPDDLKMAGSKLQDREKDSEKFSPESTEKERVLGKKGVKNAIDDESRKSPESATEDKFQKSPEIAIDNKSRKPPASEIDDESRKWPESAIIDDKSPRSPETAIDEKSRKFTESAIDDETRKSPYSTIDDETRKLSYRAIDDETRNSPYSAIDDKSGKSPESANADETRKSPYSVIGDETRKSPYSAINAKSGKSPDSAIDDEIRKSPDSQRQEKLKVETTQDLQQQVKPIAEKVSRKPRPRHDSDLTAEIFSTKKKEPFAPENIADKISSTSDLPKKHKDSPKVKPLSAMGKKQEKPSEHRTVTFYPDKSAIDDNGPRDQFIPISEGKSTSVTDLPRLRRRQSLPRTDADSAMLSKDTPPTEAQVRTQEANHENRDGIVPLRNLEDDNLIGAEQDKTPEPKLITLNRDQKSFERQIEPSYSKLIQTDAKDKFLSKLKEKDLRPQSETIDKDFEQTKLSPRDTQPDEVQKQLEPISKDMKDHLISESKTILKSAESVSIATQKDFDLDSKVIQKNLEPEYMVTKDFPPEDFIPETKLRSTAMEYVPETGEASVKEQNDEVDEQGEENLKKKIFSRFHKTC